LSTQTDPRQRLKDIRDSLISRIAQAEREGRAGEAEGLKVSLAAAKENSPKLTTRSPAAAQASH